MTLDFAYGAVVAYYHSVKSPLLPQYGVAKPFVCGGRNSFDGIERGHNRAYTLFYSRFVRWQILIVHPVAAHVDSVVVASGFGRAIESIVF